jgi:ribosomal-protein-serine acetyltransferase
VDSAAATSDIAPPVPSEVHLEVDGIALRPLGIEHAAAIDEAVRESAEELSGTVPWWRPEMTVTDHEAWIRFTATAWADDRLYAFVIVTARGALLGACSLEGVDRQRSAANLSYWVRSSATGRGVARTAARLLGEWGIRTLGLHRVEISMVTTNAASRAAAAGSGAVAEGVLRNKARWGGQSRDMAVFSFVPTDFDR